MNSRRHLLRISSIACLTAMTVACYAGIALAAPTRLWECNNCHQQYQGNAPPPAIGKCPAKGGNHWWIPKKS